MKLTKEEKNLRKAFSSNVKLVASAYGIPIKFINQKTTLILNPKARRLKKAYKKSIKVSQDILYDDVVIYGESAIYKIALILADQKQKEDVLNELYNKTMTIIK
jgi:hypothetical protein